MTQSPQAFWLDELGRADDYVGWVFEHVRPHLAGDLLEVGCGLGTYTRLLARSAKSVTALDIDEDFAQATRSVTMDLANVEVKRADVLSERYAEAFDTVFMLDVLEHIGDERLLLQNLARALRPSGRLVLKVPAFGWLYGAMDRVVGHQRRYSSASLSKVLAATGFVKSEIWYFNAAAIPAWWLYGVALGRTVPPAGQMSLFERALPLVKAIDRLARPVAGLSLFAVAEKGKAQGEAMGKPPLMASFSNPEPDSFDDFADADG